MQKMYKVKKPTPMIVFIWNKLKDLNHKDFFFFLSYQQFSDNYCFGF